jgi:hypothetical protein
MSARYLKMLTLYSESHTGRCVQTENQQCAMVRKTMRSPLVSVKTKRYPLEFSNAKILYVTFLGGDRPWSNSVTSKLSLHTHNPTLELRI